MMKLTVHHEGAKLGWDKAVKGETEVDKPLKYVVPLGRNVIGFETRIEEAGESPTFTYSRLILVYDVEEVQVEGKKMRLWHMWLINPTKSRGSLDCVIDSKYTAAFIIGESINYVQCLEQA